MNPPTSSSSQGGSSTTIVLGSGTNGTTIPFHQHPPSALTAPVGDDQLPERLGTLAPRAAGDNAFNMLETGWWSAHNTTVGMPAVSQWACQTIRSGADDSLHFLTQIAYEVEVPYRVYRRNLQVLTWSDWKRLDPVSVGYRSTAANQTLTNNTFVTLNLGGTADHDIGSGFSIASNVVTITAAGTYRFDAAAYFNIASGNTRHVLYIESWTGADPGVGLGTQIAYHEQLGTSVHYSAMGCGTTKTVAAGQKVRLIGFQAQGTNNTTLGATYPHQLNIQSVSV